MLDITSEIYYNMPLLILSLGLVIYMIYARKNKNVSLSTISAMIIICITSSVLTTLERYIGIRLDELNALFMKSDKENMRAYLKSINSKYININVVRYLISSVLYTLKPVTVMLFWTLIKNEKNAKKLFLYSIPAILNCVLFSTSFLTHLCYYFDNKSFDYVSGSLHFFIYLASLFYVALIIYEAIKRYKENRYKDVIFIIFLAVSFLTTALMESYWMGSTDIQILNTVIMEILVFYYLLLQTKSFEQNIKMKEQLLIDKENSLKMSQINPHFIFNTLTSIIDLCPENSEAQKALYSFSKYLRVNTDSIGNEHPISFAKELEHIKIFVELGKYSYEDRLTVEYDIDEEDFLIPSLSVQPLVENSIKYTFKISSVCKMKIETKHDEGFNYVIITDNGPGFDGNVVNTDDKIHIGVENIKYRLREISGASLNYEILSEGGTKATIALPKGDDNK